MLAPRGWEKSTGGCDLQSIVLHANYLDVLPPLNFEGKEIILNYVVEQAGFLVLIEEYYGSNVIIVD